MKNIKNSVIIFNLLLSGQKNFGPVYLIKLVSFWASGNHFTLIGIRDTIWSIEDIYITFIGS